MSPIAQHAGLAFALALPAGALLAWASLAYARRRALLDLPGRRRNHSVPTPRGGGIAIVLVLLGAVACLLQAGWLPARLGLAFGGGLALVAAVGWIDDHRPLRAVTRLAVHLLAAAWFVWALPPSALPLPPLAAKALQFLLLASAINFWNFMDGIDGLAATQSAFVAAMLAVLFGLPLMFGWAALAAALAGACLGFLPFNFPRARIFMGDVGSGGLGFACGALLLVAESIGAVHWMGALVLASVLFIDAGLTLLGRMARGHRWYDAHRDHLYQWLVRRGRSHARVTLSYLSWNLLVVMPVLVLMRSTPAWSAALGAAALAAGTLAWWLARTRLLREARG